MTIWSRRWRATGCPPDEIRRLLERTEGWAVGVQLAAVSLGRRRTARLVREFAGDDRHVADSSATRCFPHVDAQLQRFLLDTAILDRFNASLSTATTGDEDAGRHLEELERLNLFLLPLDHRREWIAIRAVRRSGCASTCSAVSKASIGTRTLVGRPWFRC